MWRPFQPSDPEVGSTRLRPFSSPGGERGEGGWGFSRRRGVGRRTGQGPYYRTPRSAHRREQSGHVDWRCPTPDEGRGIRRDYCGREGTDNPQVYSRFHQQYGRLIHVTRSVHVRESSGVSGTSSMRRVECLPLCPGLSNPLNRCPGVDHSSPLSKLEFRV